MNRLYWSFGLIVSFAIIELLGAYFSQSLSLGADALHMVTDAVGVSIAVVTGRIAAGYFQNREKKMVEARGAQISMTMLSVVAIGVILFAVWRFLHPVVVESQIMMFIASLGLVVNIVVLWFLNKERKESLNLGAVHFHVVSDTVTSVVVLIGAALIVWSKWEWIDPVAGIVIGSIIFLGAWHLRNGAIRHRHDLQKQDPQNNSC